MLITGAASGIGRPASLRFAEDGASIALLDIRADELKTTSDEVRRLGAEAMAFTVDTSKEPEVSAAFAAVNDSFGGLDSVVAAAGISMTLTGDGRVDELDKENLGSYFGDQPDGDFIYMQICCEGFCGGRQGSNSRDRFSDRPLRLCLRGTRLQRFQGRLSRTGSSDGRSSGRAGFT